MRLTWDDVVRWAPEILLVMPCGFHLRQVPALFARPGWVELSAVKSGRGFAVDANAYFARPGPRLVEGVELLAHLIHPELIAWPGAADAFGRVESVTIKSGTA